MSNWKISGSNLNCMRMVLGREPPLSKKKEGRKEFNPVDLGRGMRRAPFWARFLLPEIFPRRAGGDDQSFFAEKNPPAVHVLLVFHLFGQHRSLYF